MRHAVRLACAASLIIAWPSRAEDGSDLTKPVVVWSGRSLDASEAPAERWEMTVIGADAVFAKFWAERRAGEVRPQVDFTRSVVVAATWKGMAAGSIHLGPCGKHRHAVWVGAYEGRIVGTGYVAGVFLRDGISDIEGKPLPK